MKNQPIRSNSSQLSRRATGQKNSKPPETNPHRNDSADQDSVAEITQWRRSRRHPSRRTAGRPSVEISGSLRRKVLKRCRKKRMNDTTNTSNIQTNTCEPIPTEPRADSVSSCPTEPQALPAFPRMRMLSSLLGRIPKNGRKSAVGGISGASARPSKPNWSTTTPCPCRIACE